METTGQRFKRIRQELQLSQIQMADSIGLSKSGISAVENDLTFVSQKIMRTLFMEYNVNLNYLVCGEGSMFNPPKYEDVKDEILKEVEKMLKDRGL